MTDLEDQLRSIDAQVVSRALGRLVDVYGYDAESLLVALDSNARAAVLTLGGPAETWMDIVEEVYPTFVESRQAFGAMAYMLEDVAARHNTLAARALSLREAVRQAFIDEHGLVPPTRAEDERLNPRIQIDSGSFLMGSPAGVGLSDEQPQHQVRVVAFVMQEHEVTNEEYQRFDSSHTFPSSVERHPAAFVNWYEAMAYAAWLGGSLPTEAQWEFAARGAKGREYPWGPGPVTCQHAQYSECRPSGTVPVKSAQRGATPEGIYDLAGNVWEWVTDWYGSSYEAEDTLNPRGPEQGLSRVLRGGSFGSAASSLRAAFRFNIDPESVIDIVGFRVVWLSAGGQD